MNQKLTSLLLSATLLFLAACAGEEAENKTTDAPVVVNDQGAATSQTPTTTEPTQSDLLSTQTAAAKTNTSPETPQAAPKNEEAVAKKEEKTTPKQEKLPTEAVENTASANERTVNTPITEKPVAATKPAPKTVKMASDKETIASAETKTTESPMRGMAPSKSSKSAAVMKIDNPTYDFGSIHEGDEVTHTFTIRNVGTADLVIDNAKPSCGCTIPDIPLEPIAPGKTSEIKVRFNSKNKVSTQRKTIDIMTNAGVYQIALVGTVYPKEEEKLGN